MEKKKVVKKAPAKKTVAKKAPAKKAPAKKAAAATEKFIIVSNGEGNEVFQVILIGAIVALFGIMFLDFVLRIS